MNKQVRDNPTLFRNTSNAIINVDNYGYAARQKQIHATNQQLSTISELTSQVAELRELATGLMQMLKTKEPQ